MKLLLFKKLLQVKKYFLGDSTIPGSSKLETRRILITNLLSILAVIIFSVDVYANYTENFFLLAAIEMALLVVIVVNYVAFRHTKNLLVAAALLTSVQSFTAIIALIIPGYGQEMAIFWVSSLPLYIFFLHGLKRGVLYSLINVFAIFMIIVVVEFKLYPELFSLDLLWQVFIGYMAVSLFVYYMEKIRSEYEKEVGSLAAERKVLLQEIHHRVKNNMQIMISLLWLQSQKIKNPEDSKIFLDNADRLSVMSLVHESLYSLDDLEFIDLKIYINDIIKKLQTITTYTLYQDIATLKVKMKDAMTLGLIINETVTNSMQHAFKDKNECEVYVTFSKDDNLCVLSIRDNGRNLISLDDLDEGFGFTLVRDLAKSLTNAEISLNLNSGLEIQIKFED